jgi:SAM-dependent methyltransferase
VLSPGEGEGRNAAFLAGLGHPVRAVDQSAVGLATDLGRTIETVCADLAEFPIKPGAWAGIVLIFCHLPHRVRVPLYAAAARGLRPGGVFILEAYTPAQVARGTGGPKDPDMLVSLSQVTEELSGLELVHACELEREVREGAYHTGLASVVQVVGVRPRAEPDAQAAAHGR